MWPDWEFWVSQEVLVGAALAMGLAVIGAIRHDLRWYVAAAIIGATAWYSGAVVAQQRTKPDRDYVYFVPNPDPRDTVDGQVGLLSVATGPLKDVRVAIQTTEESRNNSWNYFKSGAVSVIDEGTNRTGIRLPPGDWTFDSDTLSTPGKVRERLLLVQDETGKFTAPTLTVWRKATGEILVPEPERMPTSAKVAIGAFVFVMCAFSIPLLWVSRNIKPDKNIALERIELSAAITDAQEGNHPAKYIQVAVRAVGNLLGCQTVLESVSRIDGELSTVVYNQPLNAGWSGTSELARDINNGQTIRANLFSVSYIDGLDRYDLIPQTRHQDAALHLAVNAPGLYELTIHASSRTSPAVTKSFRLRWTGTLDRVLFSELPP